MHGIRHIRGWMRQVNCATEIGTCLLFHILYNAINLSSAIHLSHRPAVEKGAIHILYDAQNTHSVSDSASVCAGKVCVLEKSV